MRFKLGMLQITGLVFLALTLLILWFAFRNFWAYSRMRNVDATVVDSGLKIDLLPAEDSESTETMIYVLTLDLRAEDGSGREMHWEGDAGQAAYPEEALDELLAWKPGSRHHIQMIRGNARELRLSNLQESPELEAGIGCLVAAMLFAMGTLVGLADMNEKSWLSKRFQWTKKLGPWAVFFGFGLMPLIGWVFFTYFTVTKILTWKEVTAQRIEHTHYFDTAKVPPGVEITPAAKKKLESTSYDVISYVWNGQTVHGGMRGFHGVHDSLHEEPGVEGRFRFKIDPRMRWNVSDTLGWNSDFWVPFGMLLFFGVAFCGAGLLVRRSF